MTSISDKILDIEKKIDVSGFRYQGENVWPVIRLSIYLESTKSSGTTPDRFLLSKSLPFLIGGVLQVFLRFLKRLFAPKHYDSVLITTSHYKVQENGKTFDKIISPVLDFLQNRKKSFRVWEFTAKFKYDKNLSYQPFLRPIQKEIYFLSFIQKIKRRFNNKEKLYGDVSGLNDLLKEHRLKFRIDTKFMNKLGTIFFQASFFENTLKRHAVKRVFVVCYYDVKCFSVILAANRLGISSIDMQHGVQGQNHLAYAHWPKELNNKFIPTHFYVWDENSYETISQWKLDKDRILIGCNKWFLDRAKKISNDIILVSLQPIENFLPEFLLEIIAAYSGEMIWHIRLHPRQLGEMQKVERLLSTRGLKEKVNLKEASLQPLTNLLQRTAVHVTYYSSVAIEASYYNIPTYFLSEESMAHYVHYLPDNLLYHYPKHQIESVIDGVANAHGTIQNNGAKRINVLDKFINANQ